MHKRIYLDGSKSRSVLLKREIELPFVPYVGLSFADGLWTPDPLVKVCWLLKDKLFSCETSPLIPEQTSRFSGSEQVEIHLREGWKPND